MGVHILRSWLRSVDIAVGDCLRDDSQHHHHCRARRTV